MLTGAEGTRGSSITGHGAGLCGRFLLAAALIGAFARPTGAARVRMSAAVGHANRVQPGRWIPLRVQVSGAPERTAIEIVKPGVVERFECRSRDSYAVECPVFAEETGSVFTVRLVSGAVVVAEQVLTTADKGFPGHLVLTADVPASIQQAVSASLLPIEPVAVVSVGLSDLPRHGLSYDSVSGLVIADPGPVLNPAQVEAMRSWLAGGGRLVVLRVRPWRASIISLLFSTPIPARGARIGLGRVVLAGVEMEAPARARELLDLVPYERTRRLTASRCAGDPVRIPSPRKPDALPLALGGWAALVILAGFLAGRRKALIWLILATTAGTVVAVPVGVVLDRSWRRGAVLHTRAVILPDIGGALVFSEVYPGKGTSWIAGAGSPWEMAIGTTASKESGLLRISEGGAFVWRHEAPLPDHVVNRSDHGLTLAGLIPTPAFPQDAEALARTAVSPRIGILNGGRWRLPISGGEGGVEWREIEGEPAWLAGGSAWVGDLVRLLPDLPWLVGYGPVAATRLTLQGVADEEALWAMPLLEGSP